MQSVLLVVPGRKTDVSDSQWLCRLLECGLLRASFVAPKPVRELRELTRRRKTLVRDRQREAGRLHKALEDTGIKLDCVATDILGVSGRLMSDANQLIGGERDPATLAGLAKGRLRVKHSALIEAFEGVRFGDQHALLIDGILRHIDFLDAEIDALGAAIETHIAAQSQPARDADQTGVDAGTARPFELAAELMCSLPGIQQRTAQTLIGEFGIDMSRFPGNAAPAAHAKARSTSTRPSMTRRWARSAPRTATSLGSTGASRPAPATGSRSALSSTRS
jgi:transposase